MQQTASHHEKQLSIHEYLEIAWRRKWWLVIPLFISLAAGIILLVYLPKTYRSSTLILVEAQKVPEDYVKSAVSGTIEDRLTTIRQEILSRTFLQKVIDDLGLYQKEPAMPLNEGALESMRKNIEIKTDSTHKTVDAFTISFEGSDPKTTMVVTNKLATLYIEENLKTREQLVEGTTEFLEKELQSLKVSLDKQEQNISQHKQKFMGSLPQQLDANLRSLDRYQMELQTISTSLMVAEDKKNLLEGKISALEGKIKESNFQGLTEENSMAASMGNPVEDDLTTLAKMKKTLEALRQEYTEAYPDIIILKRKIKEMEDSLSHRLTALKQQEKNKLKAKPKDNLDQTLYALKTNNSELQKQLDDVNNEIVSLKERERAVNGSIRLLEKAVAQTPIREQQMEVILRDYENTKKAYQALLDKKLNAELSENLEKRQKGEQFRILDPANFPQKPVKPDPIRLIGISLAIGLGGGICLVFLMETLDTSFKKPEELEKEFGFYVLGEIPKFNSKKTNTIKKAELIKKG